jgi:hypothetical protein
MKSKVDSRPVKFKPICLLIGKPCICVVSVREDRCVGILFIFVGMKYTISKDGEVVRIINLTGAALSKRPKHYFDGIPKRRYINRAKFYFHPKLDKALPFSCN